uniref:BTB domain-containing protein n=1 Tax=Panagrolaimus sp. JU765 TaxID=591449 RepID=A0AC34RHW4_9BILA
MNETILDVFLVDQNLFVFAFLIIVKFDYSAESILDIVCYFVFDSRKRMSCKIVLKSELEVPKEVGSRLNAFKDVVEKIDDFNLVFTRPRWRNFALCLDVKSTTGVPFTGVWTCNFSDGTSEVVNIDHKSGPAYSSFSAPPRYGRDSLKVSSVVNITYSPITEPPNVENDSKDTTMLEDESFKDFTICVGNEAITVHKSVLAFSSPELKTMLEHCKESQDVVIEDFDFDTVKAVVNLMYTRKMDDDLSIETLLNMAKFAHKFDLIDAVSFSFKNLEIMNF